MTTHPSSPLPIVHKLPTLTGSQIGRGGRGAGPLVARRGEGEGIPVNALQYKKANHDR
jgi:hypothetical protein